MDVDIRATRFSPAWLCLQLAEALRPHSPRWWVLLRYAAVHRLGARWRVGPDGDWRP